MKNPPQFCVPFSFILTNSKCNSEFECSLIVGLFNLIVFVGMFQIILKEDITDLGKKGQLLSVKAGYYRNYLLPLGKAQIVTPLLLK